MKTHKGKCPKCCPDGGAYFDLESRRAEDGSLTKTVRVCRNCGHELPFARQREPSRPNARQEAVIDLLLTMFGGGVETKRMIGRAVWISVVNEGRHFMLGQRVFGTVGKYGKIDLTLLRVGGDVKMRSRTDVSVYLKR